MKSPFTVEQSIRMRSQMFVAGFTVLLVAAIYYFSSIWSFISTLVSLITPFLLGFSLAFLLTPVLRRFEWLFHKFIFRRDNHPKLVRALSTTLSIGLLLALLALFFVFMVPQLVKSIESIAKYISIFLKTNSDEVNKLLGRFNLFTISGDNLVVMWDNIVASLFNNISTVVNNLMQISSSIVNFFYTILVSLVTAFYLLMDKERLTAQLKKLGYALCARERFESLTFWLRRANRIFAGFITGKIVDSLIIGCICYFCMLIFRMEYPLLISMVIGVTNVIPFFGPFIGWAPSTVILLLVNPMSALWFTVFVLVLQQLDGNVIGPFILGDYVGVSALSIMVAIVIGSGLFGFVGMVLSVPLYALLSAICRTLIDAKLKKKNLPTETMEYEKAPEHLRTIDPDAEPAEKTQAKEDEAKECAGNRKIRRGKKI